MNDQISDWLTPQEAASEADCSPSWITSLLSQGKLTGQRKGRQWLVHRDELKKVGGLRKRRKTIDVGAELSELRDRIDELSGVLAQAVELLVAGNRQGRATQEMVSAIVDATGAQLAGHGTPDPEVDLAAGDQDDLDAELAATADTNREAAEVQ